ncbi:hypothetical protein J3R30DRAFT_3709601 [Lentinula aciculospora]|uniref:Cation/H+ exchanger transmembrane domain-containing protein n=1 Tax=Lentinula aciculospora TaxID=153920 RepID=A0A9W9DIG8_9AGAR|nr:hypothetical protein J3R30DRAFT_3709601 [Lentinula aciculospora]
MTLLYNNIPSSILVGGSGIILPIALAITVVHFGFGYNILQSFAARASLSSTSLGTTLALFKPELHQTRIGIVLLSAALFHDVVGLVIAAIIQTFSSNPSGSIPWQDIVRPVLGSVAFVVVTWLLLFFLAAIIAGFVAGANYAGTSELFGAHLAGVLVAHIFHAPPEPIAPIEAADESHVSLTLVATGAGIYTPHLTSTIFI